MVGDLARRRVGDDPLASSDLHRHDVPGREVCMAMRSPPPGLQLAERLHHDLCLLDRVDRSTLAPGRLRHSRVRRTARDRDGRDQAAPAGDPDVEPRRLGHDARIRTDAVSNGGGASGPGRFLVGHRAQHEVAVVAARRSRQESLQQAPSRRRRPSCRTRRVRTAGRLSRLPCTGRSPSRFVVLPRPRRCGR